MGQTPLVLVDNLFDTFNLYPYGTLTTTSEMSGREGWRVADYRRERSWWQAAVVASNHNIKVDLGQTLGVDNKRNADYLWLDRGHNLAGLQVMVQYSDDGAAWTNLKTLTVPLATANGGDPTLATLSRTEEGCAWALFTAAAAAHRYWMLNFPANMAPIVPGIMLGARTQMFGFSKVFDEDAGDRLAPSDQSTAGYRGNSNVYAWRKCLLDLGAIGAPDYDATMRMLRRTLFERNQPCVVCLDWAGHPERGWLFQYDGASWGFPMNRVLRAGQIPLREVGQLLI